jgi:hypothetical protein
MYSPVLFLDNFAENADKIIAPSNQKRCLQASVPFAKYLAFYFTQCQLALFSNTNEVPKLSSEVIKTTRIRFLTPP